MTNNFYFKLTPAFEEADAIVFVIDVIFFDCFNIALFAFTRFLNSSAINAADTGSAFTC